MEISHRKGINNGFETRGKKAIVWGSVRCMGRQMALALAREEVNIIIPDFNCKGAKHLKEEILNMGPTAQLRF